MDNDYIIKFDNVSYIKKSDYTFSPPFSFELKAGEGALIACSNLNFLKNIYSLVAAWQPIKSGKIFWWKDARDGPDKNLIYKYYKFYSNLGIIHRESQLLANMTVLEMFAFAYEYREKISLKEAIDKTLCILEKFNLLPHKDKTSSSLIEPIRRLTLYALIYSGNPILYLLERPKQFLDFDFEFVWKIILEDIKVRGSALIVFDRHIKIYSDDQFKYKVNLN